MPAIKQDITIEQGTDFEDPFVLPATSPIDLTGATAVMQVRTSYTDPTALVTLTTDDDTLVLTGKTITPLIPAALTSALLPGVYVYDVKLVLASGRTVRPFQGV